MRIRPLEDHELTDLFICACGEMFAGPQAESEIRRHLLGIQMNPKQEHAIIGRERVPVPEIVAVKTNHGWAVIEVPHMLLELVQQLHDQAERLSRDVQTVEIPMEDAPPESIEQTESIEETTE